MTDAPPDGSLDGIVVATTALAHVDGRRGVALVRGYSLPDLAERCAYEDIAHLVITGELPRSAADRETVSRRLCEASVLDAEDVTAIGALRHGRIHADALAAAIVLAEDEAARALDDPTLRAERVLARVPAVIAAVTGTALPKGQTSYARRALSALGGKRHDEPAVRALEVLLALETEHGLSASTFACRIAASSGANAGPSLAAAVATLSGPRHGGATAEALGLLEEASRAGDIDAFVRERHARKARLPGFGHRIYKVADPRLPPLRRAMHAMGDVPLLATAEALERAGAPLYGAKGVHANIDLFGAALLHALGVERSEFVAAFAVGVACGWLAHWCEQRATGRLVRPDSTYSGPAERPVPDLRAIS